MDRGSKDRCDKVVRLKHYDGERDGRLGARSGGGLLPAMGTDSVVPHWAHRTFLPLALTGTRRMARQVRLGHIMVTTSAMEPRLWRIGREEDVPHALRLKRHRWRPGPS